MSKVSRWRIYNRKVLVETFQLQLAGVAVLHFALFALIVASTLFVPIIIRLESGDISSPHVQAAAREFLWLHTRLWPPLFGAFILLVLHNILVTHRVAGPLYRFRRHLKAVGDGDLSSPMRVRRTDYLKQEAEVINDMVESLSNKVARAEQQLEEASGVCTDLRNALADGAEDELEQKINDIGNRLEDCRASMAVFKTATEHTPSAKKTTETSVEPAELKT